MQPSPPALYPLLWHACTLIIPFRRIQANYGKIKEVERELASLQLQLRVNVGPKKHALEMLRRKIETQNEKVKAATARRDVTKKVRAGWFRTVQKLVSSRKLEAEGQEQRACRQGWQTQLAFSMFQRSARVW